MTGVPNCVAGAAPNLNGVEGCAFEGAGCGAALPKVNVPALGAAASAPKLGAVAVELPNENEGVARVPKEGAVVGAAEPRAEAGVWEL